MRAARAGGANGNLTRTLEGAIGEAKSTDRAPRALRNHWLTDRLAQFHQCLIERAGSVSGKLSLERRCESGAHAWRSHIASLQGQAGRDTDPVRFEGEYGFVERETRDGVRNVGANAGQFAKLLGGSGKYPPTLSHQFSSGRVEMAGPRVISRAFPEFEHVLLRCSS